MGFWKASLTALLVVIVFSFTSTVLTTQTHAQEVALDALKKASVSKTCIQDTFVLPSKPCSLNISTKKKNAEFLPTSNLIPEIELKKVELNKEEVYVVPQVNFATEPTGTLSAEVLFSMVNTYRTSIALPAFEKEAQICSVAESRREGIAQEIYQGLPLHSGFWSMNLPYFATENMIYQNTEAEALNWWLNSPVHRSAIEGNYKYACGVCNGEVCNLVFTNYDPKVFTLAPTLTPTPAPTLPSIVPIDTKNAAAVVLTRATKNFADTSK